VQREESSLLQNKKRLELEKLRLFLFSGKKAMLLENERRGKYPAAYPGLPKKTFIRVEFLRFI